MLPFTGKLIKQYMYTILRILRQSIQNCFIKKTEWKRFICHRMVVAGQKGICIAGSFLSVRDQPQKARMRRGWKRQFSMETRTYIRSWRGKDSWEKNHRKGRVASSLAFALCSTALILAGTSAAAETDGIHQKQTQEKKQGEKNKEKIILKIETDTRQIPAARQGRSGI